MSLSKNTFLYKLFYPIIILSLLTFSCSSDNSITGDSNQTTLSKPNEITEYFSKKSDPTDNFTDAIEKIFEKLWPALEGNALGEQMCFSGIIALYSGSDLFDNSGDDGIKKIQAQQYDFRDNYLSNSDKGLLYIGIYYYLSKYGIENDLVLKYISDHSSIILTSANIIHDLQYGIDDNQILINRSTYDDLNDIVKIYRDSENHKDTDVVLDYLETDLEKYYNITKTEIAVDFE